MSNKQTSEENELTELLASLLPACCGCAVQAVQATSVSSLFPDEAASVVNAVPKRQLEFAAGRVAARRALAMIGAPAVSIPVTPDRAPRWPGGIVGSITHAQDLAVAVVSSNRTITSIGVDLERSGAVSAELWNTVFRPEEHVTLRALSETEQTSWAALAFSAKETFFKYQFPLTGQWLDFQEARVSPVQPQQFKIDLEPGAASARLGQTTYWGRYGFTAKHTLTCLFSLTSRTI